MRPFQPSSAVRLRAEPWLLGSLLAVAGLGLAFAAIAAEVGDAPSAFDRAVILAFRSAANPAHPVGPAWLQEAARDVTGLGSHVVLGVVVLTVLGYLLLVQQRAAAWVLVVSVLGGVALNNLLKLAFARPRPDLVAPAARVFTASFPSGHATLAAITYLTLAALLARTQGSRRVRIYFMTAGAAIAVLVGVSRIYLGVHYPTDVLAGWCIGSAWAIACWLVVTRLQREGRGAPPGQR
jgi:undecaprenyl-diphosphatase